MIGIELFKFRSRISISSPYRLALGRCFAMELSTDIQALLSVSPQALNDFVTKLSTENERLIAENATLRARLNQNCTNSSVPPMTPLCWQLHYNLSAHAWARDNLELAPKSSTRSW